MTRQRMRHGADRGSVYTVWRTKLMSVPGILAPALVSPKDDATPTQTHSVSDLKELNSQYVYCRKWESVCTLTSVEKEQTVPALYVLNTNIQLSKIWRSHWPY